MLHNTVVPLPTSPVTLMMPSPWLIAYSSASSIGPRLPPPKKNSVFGVMRKRRLRESEMGVIHQCDRLFAVVSGCGIQRAGGNVG